jgi:hypothetical protein
MATVTGTKLLYKTYNTRDEENLLHRSGSKLENSELQTAFRKPLSSESKMSNMHIFIEISTLTSLKQQMGMTFWSKCLRGMDQIRVLGVYKRILIKWALKE